jgi:hypothetical protein
MAIKSQGLGAFNYTTFKDELSATKFTSSQDGPMKLRLDLLESFMKRSKKTSKIRAQGTCCRSLPELANVFPGWRK